MLLFEVLDEVSLILGKETGMRRDTPGDSMTKSAVGSLPMMISGLVRSICSPALGPALNLSSGFRSVNMSIPFPISSGHDLHIYTTINFRPELPEL